MFRLFNLQSFLFDCLKKFMNYVTLRVEFRQTFLTHFVANKFIRFDNKSSAILIENLTSFTTEPQQMVKLNPTTFSKPSK